MNIKRLSLLTRLGVIPFPGEDPRTKYIDFWNFWVLTDKFLPYTRLQNHGLYWTFGFGNEWHQCSPEMSKILTTLYKIHIRGAVEKFERTGS